MKIYLFPWANGTEQVVRAMTDEGEAIVQSIVAGVPGRDALVDTVAHVRGYVVEKHPDALIVWVDAPLDHPLLLSLISKPADEEEPAPAPVVINHLCDTCVHARVCNVSAATNAIGASIGICAHHLATEEQ